MNDLERGRKVFQSFYRWSVHYYPKTFNFSFDVFLRKYQPNEKKMNIILDGIGGAIRETKISDARVENAMMKLALSSRGKMPANYQDFFKYLSGEAVKINWIDAAAFVTVETGKDLIRGSAAIGDSILTAGKALNSILPLLLIGGVLIFAFSWLNRSTGGDAGRMFKALRK